MAYLHKNYIYNDKLSTEENLLLDKLFKLRLSHMSEALEKQFLNPNTALEDFNTRISEIINYEWDQRQSTKFNKLFKKASLKYPTADFDDCIYESDRMLDTRTIELLQKCEWIDEPKNLLITGSAGAGKTHIANALCIAALHQLRTVKYIRANALLQESEKARHLGNAYDFTNHLASFDLLVIDDFGLMELDMEKCRDLFKDNTYTDACLSRMTSKAYRLECNGRDMRNSKQ